MRQGDSCRTQELFKDDFGQLREVCSFENIGQSLFYAKLFKCK